MRDNEVVVRKRARELMFQTVWLCRAGLHLASHPPRVLAYRQMVALHPRRLDHAADRRRPHGRFDLPGGPVDDAGGHMDHPTVRACFDNDRVAPVGWRGAAGFGQTPACPVTWRGAPHTLPRQPGVGIVWQGITGQERDRPIGRRLQPTKQAARIAQGALPYHPGGHHLAHRAEAIQTQVSPETSASFSREVRGSSVLGMTVHHSSHGHACRCRVRKQSFITR